MKEILDIVQSWNEENNAEIWGILEQLPIETLDEIRFKIPDDTRDDFLCLISEKESALKEERLEKTQELIVKNLKELFLDDNKWEGIEWEDVQEVFSQDAHFLVLGALEQANKRRRSL